MSKSDQDKEPIDDPMIADDEKKVDGETKNESKKDDASNDEPSQTAIAESLEEDEEEKEELDEDENTLVMTGSNYATVGKKSFLGHTCTLKTLLDDQVLIAEDGALSFEFMGKPFIGDLMPNGNIKWQETKQTFTTPSGWVNHCKKLLTTEMINKTVSAWSVIKYRGKRLDSYKLRWYRMKKKSLAEQSSNSMATQNAIASSFNASNLNNGLVGMSYNNGYTVTNNVNASTLMMDKGVKSNTELLNSINPGLAALYNEATKSQLSCDEDPAFLKLYNVIEHAEVPKKYVFNDADIKYLNCNQLVRAVPFRSLDRIQPFTISVSTNALLLMDYHCHLTTSEVVGYLAGSWDIGNHMLNIVQAFPCKVKLGDENQAKVVEDEVRDQLRQRNMSLVGWYHNHGDKPVHPSIKDIECQLEYQVTMKGNECDLAYIPCVGFICSPYFEQNQNGIASFLAYWVMPPSELTSLEYGKPMQMFYQISRDCFLTQDLLLEMRLLAHFYTNEDDSIDFKSKLFVHMPLKLETESSKVESKIVSEQNESTVSEQNESTESEQKESSKEHANKEEKDAATDEPKETEKADTETKEEIKEEPKESAELSKNEILIKSEKDEKNVTNEQLKSVSYWEKLKISLQPSLPKDLQIAEDMNEQQVQLQQQALSHFWAFLKGLLLNSSTEATNVDKKTE